jgi:hypothetical protein
MKWRKDNLTSVATPEVGSGPMYDHEMELILAKWSQ